MIVITNSYSSFIQVKFDNGKRFHWRVGVGDYAEDKAENA